MTKWHNAPMIAFDLETTAQQLIGGGLAVIDLIVAFALGVWAGRPDPPRTHAGRRGRRDAPYLSGRSPVHARTNPDRVL